MAHPFNPHRKLAHGASNAVKALRMQKAAQRLTEVTLSSSGPTRGVHWFHGPDEPCYRGDCAGCGQHTMMQGRIADTYVVCGPCVDRFVNQRMDPYLFNGRPRQLTTTRVTPYADRVISDDDD